jgi:hypothetical protein
LAIGASAFRVADGAPTDLRGRRLEVARTAAGDFTIARDGSPIATVVSLGTHHPVAFLADGRVDMLHARGDAPPSLACRIGDRLLPYVVCEERWRDDGALASLLRDEPLMP